VAVIINKNMIINFHPKERESKKGIEIIERLNSDKNHEVIHVADKSIDEWKNIIDGSEKLIFVAPVYWWGASYEFDKWAQDVLTYGYAYRYSEEGKPEGLLNGREFEMHLTHGTPNEYSKEMEDNIRVRMDKGIFGFCGAKVVVKFYDLND
jgi:putative NADPH-quinone reductase